MEENKSDSNSSLPYDIILEIISRLPVSSLMRFRSVSKQWLSSISYDPQFIKKHLFHANQNPKLTHYLQSHTSNSILIPSPFACSPFGELIDPCFIQFPSPLRSKGSDSVFAGTYNKADILSCSCNGLVLVGTGEKDHFLCNPSTRSYKRIPGNFYHYRDCTRMYGLGYDPSTDAYKMIMIARVTSCYFFERQMHSTYDSTRVRVYNSRSNSWTRIQEFPYEIFSDQQGILVNGALHWVVARAKFRGYVIVYFDLVDDRFKELEKPSWLIPDSDFDLGVSSHGFLSLRQNSEIWVMKEYGIKESWAKLTNKPDFGPPYFVKKFDQAYYVESLVSPHAYILSPE